MAPSLVPFSILPGVKVCLVEWILQQQQQQQQERKLFGRCLIGRKRGENDGGAWLFSSKTHQKFFSPKWGENLVGGNLMAKWQKCPCATCPRASVCCFFFSFFFSVLVLISVFFFVIIYFFFWFPGCCLFLLLLLFPLGHGCDSVCFDFFFFCLDVIFFLDMIFIF